ncbi:hypothetical protein ACSLN1_26560, partial [Escherichia coli]
MVFPAATASSIKAAIFLALNKSRSSSSYVLCFFPDWTFHNNDSVTFDFCKRFSHTLASFRGDEIGETKPLLSATLE